MPWPRTFGNMIHEIKNSFNLNKWKKEFDKYRRINLKEIIQQFSEFHNIHKISKLF